MLHSRGVLKRKRRYLIYYVTSLLVGQILPPSKIILFLGVVISLVVATGLHSVAATALDFSALLVSFCFDFACEPVLERDFELGRE